MSCTLRTSAAKWQLHHLYGVSRMPRKGEGIVSKVSISASAVFKAPAGPMHVQTASKDQDRQTDRHRCLWNTLGSCRRELHSPWHLPNTSKLPDSSPYSKRHQMASAGSHLPVPGSVPCSMPEMLHALVFLHLPKSTVKIKSNTYQHFISPLGQANALPHCPVAQTPCLSASNKHLALPT